jgi:hypothetical protein
MSARKYRVDISMDMQHILVARTCSMDMQGQHQDMEHGWTLKHAHATGNAACTYNMDMRHRN